MFYRRKILLALIEQCGGQVEKLRLQKLLFLLSRYQDNPTFDFVPYKFGCYSFQANSDLNTLIKYKYLKSDTQNNLKSKDLS